jgi:hypothetical protein
MTIEQSTAGRPSALRLIVRNLLLYVVILPAAVQAIFG